MGIDYLKSKLYFVCIINILIETKKNEISKQTLQLNKHNATENWKNPKQTFGG